MLMSCFDSMFVTILSRSSEQVQEHETESLFDDSSNSTALVWMLMIAFLFNRSEVTLQQVPGHWSLAIIGSRRAPDDAPVQYCRYRHYDKSRNVQSVVR